MSAKEAIALIRNKAQLSRRAQVTVYVLAVLLVAVLAFVCIMFGRSYKQLQVAIQLERMDYVQEISEQIISSQHFMKSEYSDAISNYAGIINHVDIQSLSDVRACVSSKDASDILLVSDDGKICDLNGNSIYMSDRSLIESLPKGNEVVQLFSSLNYEDDNWLFMTRINPLECEGTRFITVVLAVSSDEFKQCLAISLFGGSGASYLVKNNGTVEIMADDGNLTFSGYNLLSSMLQAGAKKSDVDMLEEDMWQSVKGSYLFKIGDQDWLISHSAIDEVSSVVVTVPLAITASQTYDGLNDTILSASMMVLVIAAIAMLFILFFFKRDRLRDREAMALAAKSDFLSKMSHDIRTPLNAIIGLDTLARDSTDDLKVKDYLKQSSSAANYLLSIINDVLEMSRIESGKTVIANAPFDMGELIAEIKSLALVMTNEKSLRFVAETDCTGIYLGDPVRLKQITMNLLSNAAKFTKEGGTVKLSITKRQGKDDIDNFTVIVSDTGIGMSKEFLTRIFKPFEQEQSSYTQQFAGSGLGLSIVYNLVSMMKGTISVNSELGLGSAFTIQMPLKRGDGVKHASGAKSVYASYKGHIVLLAEDNSVNQQIAVSILRKNFDITVETADNGMEAVNMFEASRDNYYSIVLMDVKMPIMDGLEAARRLRSLPRADAKTVPIVALSANAFEEDVELSLAAGMNDHLSKPISVAALGKALKTYIKKEERT